MGKKIWFGLGVAATLAAAWGFSLMVWANSGAVSDSGPNDDARTPSAPPPPRMTSNHRFLGHLAVKGMHNDKRNLMTSIVVHPKLWEPKPYLLFDENGFGDKYDHAGPMKINLNALRAEARHDAETAAVWWGGRAAHVMVNTEGWSLQWDASWRRPRAGAGSRAYNRQAIGVYKAIQDGIEQGWPAIDRFGWWNRIITPLHLERRQTSRGADELNIEADQVWRQVSYFAAHIYPFTRLVADSVTPGKDEAHAEEWTRPVREAVEAMVHLRSAIGGDQLVLPCMFGTSRGWLGNYKNQWMTEQERRLLVRASYEAGADGIMVWQPLRDEQERDEFQRAVVQIEAELARINGDDELGPMMTLGEMFRIRIDWPGRPMDWMRDAGDQSSQPGLRPARGRPGSR